MFRDFLNKLYGNGVVLANLHGQRDVPYLPEEKLHALRDDRLKRIVQFAAETVPYYRDLFLWERIDPKEIRTVEDLDHLPLIDKEVVRNNPQLFLSTSASKNKCIPFITSGSTGRPLTIYHDAHSMLCNIAFGEREREVISAIYGGKFGYRELYIGYPADTSEIVRNFYRQMTFTPVRPERLTLSILEPLEDIVARVNHFHPDVIISSGSYIETLFKTLHLRGVQMALPRMLLYGGDSITSDGRSYIEQEFGVPVLSRYNAVEAFKIGFTCERREGFHLHEDLCHVRIVTATGEKVANGEKGEVIISNFVNKGTVLLNYRLGDLASLSKEKCPCGRNLPLLSDLEGRVEDIIFLPNGEFVYPRAVWKVFKTRNEVLQYQLIQHELERFQLKLITVDGEIYQGVIDDVLADLRSVLGESALIEAEYFPELERQGRGKFRPVMSLCKWGELHDR